METIPNNSHYNRKQSPEWPWQLLLTAVLSLAVLFGQVVPMQAAHSSEGWMEICGGEDGSYFVQFDDDLGGQDQDCTHCSACLLAGNTATTVPNKIAGLILDLKLIDVPTAAHPAPVISHPEQYWSACRGPPLEGTEKSMIHHGSLCDVVSQSRPGKPQLRIYGGLPWS